eukprot:6470146-Amphidinium_carterae.2
MFRDTLCHHQPPLSKICGRVACKHESARVQGNSQRNRVKNWRTQSWYLKPVFETVRLGSYAMIVVDTEFPPWEQSARRDRNYVS